MGYESRHYYASLDGMRAVSILAVLLFHSSSSWLEGGFLGVEVFFVISGFIITTLLLEEYNASSRLNFGSFYKRRLRRLLPDMLITIFITMSAVIAVFPQEIKKSFEDIIPSLTYTLNWFYIYNERSYFEAIGRPRLFEHLWSLSVEFQYYLVWPLICLFLFRIRRRTAILMTLSVALVSTCLMAFLFNPDIDTSRIYFGTDTRASGLLIGSALALAFPKLKESGFNLNKFITGSVSILALVGIVICFIKFEQDSDLLYRGGFALVAVLSAVCIGISIMNEHSVTARLLGSKIMSEIGLRAYNIYIWHWPIFNLTQPYVDIQLEGWQLFIFRICLTGSLSEITYRFIDIPIRNGALGRFYKTFSGRGIKLPVKVAFAVTVFAVIGYMTFFVQSRWNVASDDAYSSIISQQIELVEMSEAVVGKKDGNVVSSVSVNTPPSEKKDTKETVPEIPDKMKISNEEIKKDYTSVNKTKEQSENIITKVKAKSKPSPKKPFKFDMNESKGYISRIYPADEKKRHYFAVGDSVMLGAASRMYKALGDDINIDAKVGRQLSAAKSLLVEKKDKGILGDIIIMHLGNNGLIGKKEFRALMDVLKDKEKIFLITLKVPRPYETANNSILEEVSRDYPNVKLIDWRANSLKAKKIFAKDGLHLTNDGIKLYTQLLVSAVQ